MSEPVKLYNANDGLTGRDPHGFAMDQVEMREAETRRAQVEGREPDYDNPGPTAGTKLVTASQLLDAATVNVAHQPAEEAASKAQAAVDNLDVTHVVEVPAEAFEEPAEEEAEAETTEEEQPAEAEPAADEEEF